MTVILILIMFAVLFFCVLYVIYDIIFKKKERGANGIVRKFIKYEKFRASIEENIRNIKAAECEEFVIESSDNYKLSAKFYKIKDGAPVAIFFHGYRSYVEFDGSYLFHIFRRLECNVLMVNQRAHGRNGARSITFGIKESDDCVRWVNFIAKKFGKDTRVILSGMSMGATTVMMASDADYRADVRGIIADCGFYSPAEAIKHSIRMRGYPVGITYFMARLSAIVFAGFDPQSRTTGDALSQTSIPVLIIHGDEDKLVPYEMGVMNYNATRSDKKLITIHGAGHAVCGGVNPELYEKEISEFVNKVINKQ